ncbi:MAG: nuclear transport factor 2 family protein [Candidatus Cybelea sp.]
MKRTLLFLTLAVAVAAGSAVAPRASAASDDNAQINALYQSFATAFRHKDVDAIMALYPRGQTLFVFDAGPPRQHVGWDDYRKDWVGFFGSMKGSPTFSIGDLGVTISGDVAYTHSIQRVTATVGKKTMTANVRVTDVLRKMDGKWLIVQEHVSVPVDFNTLKPDLLSKP